MTTATKMLDWGDKSVGFEQQHGQDGSGPTTHALVRFIEGKDGNVEISFGSTVHYGGGVLHRSDAGLVIDVSQRADLIAALYPLGGLLVSGDSMERIAEENAKLREILNASPGEEANVSEFRSWARVLKKMMREIS